jgi:hypothetical protein
MQRIMLALAIAGLTSVPAYAQLNGQNLLGDFGVGSGTQPAPGVYAVAFYYRYDTDTIRNRDGDRIEIDPSQPASQTLNVVMPFVIFVSTTKVLGANYGMAVALPFANGSLEAPAFGLEADIGMGLGDIYVAPVTLGWHTARADVNAGFAFFAPTGRYTEGADDNLSRNMWSYELSGGTTVHLDAARKWNIATAAFWEIHGAKRGSGGVVVGPVTLGEVKVGQLLTLEGGVGRAFLGGAASVGAAYHAQWKFTHDDFGLPVTTPTLLGKHRVFGFGPDVTIPIATKSSLISLVNVRYFWETGARVKTEGQSLVLSATFPIPSVEIQ